MLPPPPPPPHRPAIAASQNGEWSLCYDSRNDCTSCPSKKIDQVDDEVDGYCVCPAGRDSFHALCDSHSQTLVLGHNSLGYTFGGFAEHSWGGSAGYDHGAAADFLFRLAGGDATVYRPTGGQGDNATQYQYRDRDDWPRWGYGFDLSFGGYGAALGEPYAYCDQGTTYEGATVDVCGGDGNWGATQMEVWYYVGG
jgi:hypothetical protein